MFILKLKLNSDNKYETTLLPDKEYLIGRGEDCQIKLDPLKGISRHHVKLYFDGTDWKALRLAKFAPMQLHGQDTEEALIKAGSVLSINPYEIEFHEKSEEQTPSNSEEDDNVEIDATSLMNADTSIGAQSGQGFIKFVDRFGSPIEVLKLTNEVNIAGREESCEILIKDARVSRKQFKISNISGQYYIQDLGSVNGTYLNGKPVSAQRSTLLKSGDQITVLDHILIFELRDLDFEKQFSEIPEEIMNPPELPPVEDVAPGDLPPPPFVDNYYPQDQNLPLDGGPPPFINDETYNQLDPNLFNDPNQFQQENQPFPNHGAEKEIKLFGKTIVLNKENKMRIGLVLILFFGIMYYIGEEMQGRGKSAIEVKPLDPFAALTPQQQIEVKHSITLARNLYRQANYELARAEIEKIHMLLPKGFEDSMELQKFIDEAIRTKEELAKQEQIERDKKEAEEKLNRVISDCSALIAAGTTSELLEECLQPALEISPEDQRIADLRAQIAAIEEEKKRVQAEKEQYEELVAQLQALYNNADALAKKNPLSGIAAFKKVITSPLPDPNGLKIKSKKRITQIQRSIDSKISQSVKKGLELANSGDLKNAILTIESAFPLDPYNTKIRELSRSMRLSLKKNMQILYQEAVVEEHIGNVDAAKTRWRKIITLDVPDGDYYIKSSIKLSKYGQI